MSEVESEGSLRCDNSSLFCSCPCWGERKHLIRKMEKQMDPRKEHAVQRGRYPHPNLGRVTSAVTRGTMRRGCQIPCCVLCSPSLDHLSRPKTLNWKYPPLEETLQLSESASRQGVLLQVPSWGEEGDVLGQNHKLIFFRWHLRRTVLPRRWCSAEQPDCCWWTSKQGVKTSSSSSSAFCTRIFPVNQEPQGMSDPSACDSRPSNIFGPFFCLVWAAGAAAALTQVGAVHGCRCPADTHERSTYCEKVPRGNLEEGYLFALWFLVHT